MLARIIFFAAVTAATLAVILLPLLSPVPRKSAESQSGPGLALSLYIHPPGVGSRPHQQASVHGNSTFIFRHELREGPANTSRVIGRAQGVVVPARRSAGELATFNIVHLALDAPAYSGSLSVEARRQAGRRAGEKLVVVGGTGAFAFARGFAAFTATGDAIYHLDLRLRFPPESPR